MSEEKQATPIILDNLNKIYDILKYSEAKCLSIVALNTALCIFYFNIKNILPTNISTTAKILIFYISFLLPVILTFISSIISVRAISPKFIDTHESKNNFLFYKTIKDRNAEEIKNYFTEYSENKSDKYNIDLCKTMIAYSKLSYAKNESFCHSVRITSLSIVSLFIFIFVSQVLFWYK